MSVTDLPVWNRLHQHQQMIRDLSVPTMFVQDPNRFQRFSLSLDDLIFDYSKNRITTDTMELLLDLAGAVDVSGAIEAMFRGDKLNVTENRSVLHVALRNRSNHPIFVDGVDVMPDVNAVLAKMRTFSEAVRAGKWKGYSGKAVTDVVNIGIGGSHLGPRLATDALRPYADGRIRVHYVSNVDPSAIQETLHLLDPETTLFLIASKTFTTQETMRNARAAREWLVTNAGDEGAVARHFVALSTNAEAVKAFGIDGNNMFEFWDWVGGRFSLWSAIGLSVALYLGMDHFEALLAGAHAVDEHFRTAPLEQNIPVIMALLGVWYVNFWGADTHAVLPYDHYLGYFNDYLLQLETESNGKRVTSEGNFVDVNTGPIVWGRPGTDGQHTFYQLLHQGTRPIPADFLVAARSHNPLQDQHEVLLSHCFAQSKALMEGRSVEEACRRLVESGIPPEEAQRLAPAKSFPGNQPSNTFLYKQLTPYTLGMLCALYEHKVFVQGRIWGINSFDQMGVELGKELADTLLPIVKEGSSLSGSDHSTRGLLQKYQQWR